MTEPFQGELHDPIDMRLGASDQKEFLCRVAKYRATAVGMSQTLNYFVWHGKEFRLLSFKPRVRPSFLNVERN